MTCGRNGPPSGAAPTTAQADRTERASGAERLPTRQAGEEDPGPGDVGEAATAGQRQRHRRGPCGGGRDALDEVLDDAVGGCAHERQGHVPLVRCRPPEVAAGLAAHVEEVVEVLGDVLREVDRDEEAHDAIITRSSSSASPPRPREWQEHPARVVRLDDVTVVGEVEGLVSAVETLREAVDRASLPLDVPTRGRAEASRRALLQQLDDYVLPRLRSLDAPLLAVVGGSTGAGKSTLVNSVIGADGEPVRGAAAHDHHARPRPPPRRPALVRRRRGSCPTSRRVTGGTRRRRAARHRAPRRVHGRCRPGMALLDAPDIDSVVSREPRARHPAALRRRPLALRHHRRPLRRRRAVGPPAHRPSERGTAVAIVLDRVPPEAIADIRRHLASMLREQGLSDRPDLHRPRGRRSTPTAGCPRRPWPGCASWLTALASDARARSVVVRQTLDGALELASTAAPPSSSSASRDQQDAAAAAARSPPTTPIAEARRRRRATA